MSSQQKKLYEFTINKKMWTTNIKVFLDTENSTTAP